jgi:aminobenzoyl-glutamate transport protein
MTARENPGPRRGFVNRALDGVEAVGNRLPDTATLFVIIAVAILIVSWLAARAGVSAIHPKDGSVIEAVNLLTREGVRRIFTDAVKNFTSFAPLGIVLVAMIGIGVADRTGLITVTLRSMVMRIPPRMLTIAVITVSMLSHAAGDAGVVLMPPIGAMLFLSAGRHPLAGLCAAYAGVTGGFSANLLPSSLDVLLAGFTQEAINASKLLPGYTAQVLGNYFFMCSVVPLLTIGGALVTERIIEPRLGKWHGAGDHITELTPDEHRGLRAAGIAVLVSLAALAVMIVPSWGVLRGPGVTTLEQLKPTFDSMIILIMLLFFVPGVAYGIAARKIRSDKDVTSMTGETLGTMGTYIVLAFAAAQFVNYFAWSNLGAIIAIKGADFLKSIGLQSGALLVGFVLFTATINLLITSASAKWAVVAPVFVPMFILLGFSPEGTQAVFRVGDSCTNIITPMFPYIPFIVATVQRYDPKAGSGTLITLMIPYALTFLILWTTLLLLFHGFHWPIGPGVFMELAKQ